MAKKKARIVSTGSYLPARVLSNQDLEKLVDTSDEWIRTRTGMQERRIAAEGEFTSDLGYHAAVRALAEGGVAPEEVDLILVATLTPDYVCPSTACLLQYRLGAVRAAAFDIQAACSGYIYGLAVAKAMIESGMYQTILFVAAEKLSPVIDYTDRNTCVLFGDGAAASVIADRGTGLMMHDVRLGCDGEQAPLLMQPAGGTRCPASTASVNARQHFIRMEGKEVFKHAVRRMVSATKECLAKAGFTEAELGWIIPHQANIRIIEALAKRFGVDMARVVLTIAKYGNTAASSVGIALDEFMRRRLLKDHEPILLVAFGAGFAWGASVLTREGEL